MRLGKRFKSILVIILVRPKSPERAAKPLTPTAFQFLAAGRIVESGVTIFDYLDRFENRTASGTSLALVFCGMPSEASHYLVFTAGIRLPTFSPVALRSPRLRVSTSAREDF